MAALGDALAKAAQNVLKKFGQTATVRRDIGTFNETTGSMTNAVSTFTTQISSQISRRWHPTKGSAEVFKLMCEAKGEYIPQVGDTVSSSAGDMKIETVTKLMVGDVIAAYECRGEM